jgi:hypothetical protein
MKEKLKVNPSKVSTTIKTLLDLVREPIIIGALIIAGCIVR